MCAASAVVISTTTEDGSPGQATKIIGVIGKIRGRYPEEDFEGPVGLIFLLLRVAQHAPLLAQKCQTWIDRAGWDCNANISINYSGESSPALDFLTDLRIIKAWPFLHLTPEIVFAQFKTQTPVVCGDLKGIARLGRYLGAFVRMGSSVAECHDIMRVALTTHMRILPDHLTNSVSTKAVGIYIDYWLRKQDAPVAFRENLLAEIQHPTLIEPLGTERLDIIEEFAPVV